MDRPDFTIDDIARAQAAWRRERAKLPFPENIRIVVEMRKRRAPILEARGLKQRVWQIEEDDPAPHAQP